MVDSGPDTDTGVDSGPDTDTEVDSWPDTDTGVDSGPDTVTGVDSGPDTDTGIDSGPDTVTGVDYLRWPLLVSIDIYPHCTFVVFSLKICLFRKKGPRCRAPSNSVHPPWPQEPFVQY